MNIEYILPTLKEEKNMKGNKKVKIICVVALFTLLFSGIAVSASDFIEKNSVPPNERDHAGWTPVELEDMKNLEKTPPKPKELPPEKQKIRENEFKMRELAKKKTYYTSIDPNDGHLYWSGEAMSGVGHLLADTIGSKVGKIRFPSLDKVLVGLSFYNPQEIRRDLIRASVVIFERLPQINQIEFETYQITDSTSGTYSTMGSATTTREKYADLLQVDLSDPVQVLEAVKRHFDVSLLQPAALEP
ncbi:MAG: hypothetical protein BLM47_02570 [Candidatus Reconcilbacillus cellulovorans]|uniref:Uncharacterized protein n=1 Tax=Candidatus Reconcilbacillus cellulovorans TaxID=1906605 RepID=A0A2A6E2W6_9BACL|nr:MAG: hypothetical protein BLM47_02570 [Candidatus Reconcilbacillus cellulovorans]